jgi:hypothetical protein
MMEKLQRQRKKNKQKIFCTRNFKGIGRGTQRKRQKKQSNMKTTQKKKNLFFTFFTVRTENNRKSQIDPSPTEKQKIPCTPTTPSSPRWQDRPWLDPVHGRHLLSPVLPLDGALNLRSCGTPTVLLLNGPETIGPMAPDRW